MPNDRVTGPGTVPFFKDGEILAEANVTSQDMEPQERDRICGVLRHLLPDAQLISIRNLNKLLCAVVEFPPRHTIEQDSLNRFHDSYIMTTSGEACLLLVVPLNDDDHIDLLDFLLEQEEESRYSSMTPR